MSKNYYQIIKENFLRHFKGINNEQYNRTERNYKSETVEMAAEILNKQQYENHLQNNQYNEIIEKINDLFKRNNLTSWRDYNILRNANEELKTLLSEQIYNLLYEDSVNLEDRINSLISVLQKDNSVAHSNIWNFITYLLFIFYPDEHYFVKPSVWNNTCKGLNLEDPRNVRMTGESYLEILSVCNAIREDLKSTELEPRDMIDLQSILYIAFSKSYNNIIYYWVAKFYEKSLWRKCVDLNTIAFQYEDGEQNKASVTMFLQNAEKISEGDYVVASLKGENQFLGLGKVSSELYKETEEENLHNGSFSQRIDVEKWEYALSEPVKISFIEDNHSINKKPYQPIFKIDEEGFDKIKERLKQEIEDTEKSVTFDKLREDTPGKKQVDLNRTIEINNLYFPDAYEKRLKKQIGSAIRNNKNIILIGPPGTGKSKLAREICKSYEVPSKMVTAGSDWSTFETIGGYQPDSSNQLIFNRGLFLDCFKDKALNRNINKWLIIDEINRADIDKAFGSLFSALTGDKITLSYKNKNGENIVIRPEQEDEDINKNENEYIIPDDWRLIATMNTFDKTSLYEMSYAFMRRFAFIPVTVPKNINPDLLENYLECWEITNKNFIEDMVSIWKLINRYRKIGPAIIKDVYQYLVSTYGDFASAIIMYVFPQLEGLMEERINTIIQELTQYDNTGIVKEFGYEYFGLERIIDEA